MPTYESLAPEYAALWASIEIRPSKAHDIDATARKVLDAKGGRYKAVQEATGVPWYLIGVIHQLEGGGNFFTHLHNGDPLTRRTVQVPAGRPVAPPENGKGYTWKESAIDAVRYDGLDKVKDWSIERICFELEKYNGWGYRRPHFPHSPYLWSGTNHYAKGKYVRDSVYDPDVVSGQSGACAILKRVMELDPSVAPQLEGATHIAAPADIEEKVADPALAFPRAIPATPPPAVAHAEAHATLQETSWWYAIRRGLLKTLGLGSASGTVGIVSAAQADPVGTAESLLGFAKTYGLWLVAAILVAVLVLEIFQFIQREKEIKKEAAA